MLMTSFSNLLKVIKYFESESDDQSLENARSFLILIVLTMYWDFVVIKLSA